MSNEFHKRSNKSRQDTSKRVAAHFERRRRPEDHKRLKEQARRRRSERAGQGPRRRDWVDDDGDHPSFEKIGRTPPDTATSAPRSGASGPSDRETGGDEPARDGTSEDGRTAEALATGRVLSVERGRVTLASAQGVHDARLGEDLARTQQTAIAVGDSVSFRAEGEGTRVVEVLPRRTTLSRPDPGNAHRRRVLAANVDVAVLVLSVSRPAFRPGLVDRFLVALEHGGVAPLVVANKVDLADAGERARVEEQLAVYPALGVPALLASAETGEGLAALREALVGRTSVFVGHSGVGKSSLLNALDPSGERETRVGREGDGKGRHTTTRSTLTELADGTTVIDTPGVRAFGLWHLSRSELRDAFPELVEHGRRCRFRDCSHLVEPECAVQAGVASGAIAASRYGAYARIHASLDERA